MKLDWEFHISTEGMRMRDVNTHSYSGLLTQDRLTTFYEDLGQLHWGHGRSQETVEGYLVQSWDQEMSFTLPRDAWGTGHMGVLLDPNIKSEVIQCRVPVTEIANYLDPGRGALNFLGDRHPDHMTRVKALCILLGRYPPSLTEGNKAELHAWLKDQAAELGVNHAQANPSSAH
tara:strand:+ start:36062 stop:36583 length:522 start_codon:yes stop_codon:yes gene_type:complete